MIVWCLRLFHNRFDHPQCFEIRFYRVNAVDHHTLFATVGSEGDGRPLTDGDFGFVEDFSDKRFPGNSEEQRTISDDEPIERAQQFEIVRDGFSKADARIEADRSWIDPGSSEGGKSFQKKSADIFHDVVVMRGELHRPRIALHVHDDDAAVAASADLGHLRIGGEA